MQMQKVLLAFFITMINATVPGSKKIFRKGSRSADSAIPEKKESAFGKLVSYLRRSSSPGKHETKRANSTDRFREVPQEMNRSRSLPRILSQKLEHPFSMVSSKPIDIKVPRQSVNEEAIEVAEKLGWKLKRVGQFEWVLEKKPKRRTKASKRVPTPDSKGEMISHSIYESHHPKCMQRICVLTNESDLVSSIKISIDCAGRSPSCCISASPIQHMSSAKAIRDDIGHLLINPIERKSFSRKLLTQKSNGSNSLTDSSDDGRHSLQDSLFTFNALKKSSELQLRAGPEIVTSRPELSVAKPGECEQSEKSDEDQELKEQSRPLPIQKKTSHESHLPPSLPSRSPSTYAVVYYDLSKLSCEVDYWI